MLKRLRLLLPSRAHRSVWVIVEIEFQTGKREKREKIVCWKKGLKNPIRNVSRFDFSSSWLPLSFDNINVLACRWCNFLEWFPLSCERFFFPFISRLFFSSTLQDQDDSRDIIHIPTPSRWQFDENYFSPNLTLSHMRLWLSKHAWHDKLEYFSPLL